MTHTPMPLNAELEDVDLSSLLDPTQFQPAPSISSLAFDLLEVSNKRETIDLLMAEINQRQDKMRLLNEILAEINLLTDDNCCLDINNHAELLEKLQIAFELGAKIKKDQVKFNAIERQHLIDNLNLAVNHWSNENRKQTQQLEIYVKDYHHMMELVGSRHKKLDDEYKNIARKLGG